MGRIAADTSRKRIHRYYDYSLLFLTLFGMLRSGNDIQHLITLRGCIAIRLII